MLAQRIENAQITAIDIDNGAVEQAKYNFEQSLWADRLECQQVALQELKGENIYDLIVSNPPYFQDSLKNPDSQRAMARHTDTLSYEELLKHSARLLTNNGIIALVLPIEAEKQIIVLAKQYQLYPTHLTYVYPKPGKAAKRLLIALQAYPPPLLEYTTKCHVHFQDPRERKGTKLDDLTLESESAPRSEAYKELTKEFYL
jgi:tRNA1Val (adenine37-N6)-methyltransferase